MSNGSSSSYVGACRKDIPYPSVSSESVPSLIDNLVYALYGTITKSVINRRVVWNIPCDPNNTALINGIPRNTDEGLLCYIVRALNLTTPSGFVTVNGVQTLTNKTLTAPVINNAPITSTGSTTARTLENRFADVVNVKDFGAVGNGVVDDTVAIQAAINAASASFGAEVIIPPTGSAYRITDSLILPNGVVLRGDGGRNFNGATATNAQWTNKGSWLAPEHATNPAVKLQGHGSGIVGINFIHNQPIPTGGSWTPNVYGYCIQQSYSHCKIENVMIINASHGINLSYTTGSGGGTNVFWKDIIISAYQVRIKTTNANDTMHWSDIHCRNLWYSSDSRVVDYIRANTIGWYCQYTDNLMVDGLEFFEDKIAIYLEDTTCLGNTHSLYNATLVNVQFNLPQVCIKVATSTTTAAAYFENTLAQTGNAFGLTWSDTAFQLNSANAFFKFGNLTVRESGGITFDLGNGGGNFFFDALSVERYSSILAGQPCLKLNSGARARIGNYSIIKSVGNGSRFSGTNSDYVLTTANTGYSYFGRYSEQSLTTVGSPTAWQDYSTDFLLRMAGSGSHQIRLTGEINVTTAQASSTFSVRLFGSSATSIQYSSIPSSSTGFQSFDTGWTDIDQASLDSLKVVGRAQILSTTSGIILSNGSLNVLLR